jgi:hypothetical protein
MITTLIFVSAALIGVVLFFLVRQNKSRDFTIPVSDSPPTDAEIIQNARARGVRGPITIN